MILEFRLMTDSSSGYVIVVHLYVGMGQSLMQAFNDSFSQMVSIFS